MSKDKITLEQFIEKWGKHGSMPVFDYTEALKSDLKEMIEGLIPSNTQIDDASLEYEKRYAEMCKDELVKFWKNEDFISGMMKTRDHILKQLTK
jgi:hypothetical protein